MPDQDRREFLELLAASAAVVAFGHRLQADGDRNASLGESPQTGVAVTARTLIRTVFVSDCQTLTRHSSALEPAVGKCLADNPDVALLSAGQSLGNDFVVSQLKRLRTAETGGKSGNPQSQQLAFVLGAACSLAADQNLESLGARAIDSAPGGDRELLHAALLLREVAGTPAMARCTREELESVLSV